VLQRAPRVTPIATADHPARARRPMNAVLQPSHELTELLGVEMDWQRGVEDAVVRVGRR
jgi:hypothetical protein